MAKKPKILQKIDEPTAAEIIDSIARGAELQLDKTTHALPIARGDNVRDYFPPPCRGTAHTRLAFAQAMGYGLRT